MKEYEHCKTQIDIMLARSKTKVIFPIITFGLLNEFLNNNQVVFTDSDVRQCYIKSVKYFKKYLGHDFHIGGKYYDAYPSRNLPKYGVLKVIENKTYQLNKDFQSNVKELVNYSQQAIKKYIDEKVGVITSFLDARKRMDIANDKRTFAGLIDKQIDVNPTNFEIFSFAILKVHLEKFACKIYRDTRTAAYDKGVDLSTNFGVIYQIKKLKLLNKNVTNEVLDELQLNFSDDRIKDGNVILIIDDISKEMKSYLINMKIQTIAKADLLNLTSQLDLEDRMKVLRIVFEEFSREYKSDI